MWYIGQDVVSLITHTQCNLKKGDVKTISGLKQGCCNKVLLDVGININKDRMSLCTVCGKETHSNGIGWLSEKAFKPLDELSDISELLEVLELETVI